MSISGIPIGSSRDNLAVLSHFIHSTGYPEHANFQKLVKRARISAEEIDSFWPDAQRAVRFPPRELADFTFVDLFAGIGGMRMGAQKARGRCVFSSEWDQYAQETYFSNFGEMPFGDIEDIEAADIPNHDLLMAGFPCQSFSIAGRREGFADIRGTMFHQIARILAEKKPEAILLENVKGLRSHDGGRTLIRILEILRDELGYSVPTPEILNSKRFSVPQNRDRIFIVAFRKKRAADRFTYPTGTPPHKTVADIRERGYVPAKYFLTASTLKMLEAHKDRHQRKGNGFGMQILENTAISNAILVGGMGRERNLLMDPKSWNRLLDSEQRALRLNTKKIRKMTPREFARLQGFSEKFEIPVSDNQAYKQFGNSVTVPLIHALVKEVMKAL